MSFEEVKELMPGDRVLWTDPDSGLRSRVLFIQHIHVYGDAEEGGTVVITDVNESKLECPAGELS